MVSEFMPTNSDEKPENQNLFLSVCRPSDIPQENLRILRNASFGACGNILEAVPHSHQIHQTGIPCLVPNTTVGQPTVTDVCNPSMSAEAIPRDHEHNYSSPGKVFFTDEVYDEPGAYTLVPCAANDGDGGRRLDFTTAIRNDFAGLFVQRPASHGDIWLPFPGTSGRLVGLNSSSYLTSSEEHTHVDLTAADLGTDWPLAPFADQVGDSGGDAVDAASSEHEHHIDNISMDPSIAVPVHADVHLYRLNPGSPLSLVSEATLSKAYLFRGSIPPLGFVPINLHDGTPLRILTGTVDLQALKNAEYPGHVHSAEAETTFVNPSENTVTLGCRDTQFGRGLLEGHFHACLGETQSNGTYFPRRVRVIMAARKAPSRTLELGREYREGAARRVLVIVLSVMAVFRDQKEEESLPSGAVELMRKCWLAEPSERPDAEELVSSLERIAKGAMTEV